MVRLAAENVGVGNGTKGWGGRGCACNAFGYLSSGSAGRQMRQAGGGVRHSDGGDPAGIDGGGADLQRNYALQRLPDRLRAGAEDVGRASGQDVQAALWRAPGRG